MVLTSKYPAVQVRQYALPLQMRHPGMFEQGSQEVLLRKYPPSQARQLVESTQKEQPISAEEQTEQFPEAERKNRDSHSVQTDEDEHLLHPDIVDEQRVQVPVPR